MAANRNSPVANSAAVSSVAGTLMGLLLALGLRESGNYAFFSLLTLGLLIALGRSGLLPLLVERRRALAERQARMPFFEQVIGYLLTLLWLDSPSLLALAVGFFVYRFLDVYPTRPALRLRQAGTRDRVLMAQIITGSLAFCCMAALRFLVLPELWSLAP